MIQLTKATLMVALMFTIFAVSQAWWFYYLPLFRKRRVIRHYRPAQQHHGWGWQPSGWGEPLQITPPAHGWQEESGGHGSKGHGHGWQEESYGSGGHGSKGHGHGWQEESYGHGGHGHKSHGHGGHGHGWQSKGHGGYH